MTPTVLVTGATGFVGQHALQRLASEPVRIRVVSRPGQRKADPWPEATEVVQSADLFNESPSWWKEVCHGVDTVLHLAWYTEPGKYLQSPRNLDCLAGTISLAKGCCAANVRRVVGVGTCFEYDTSIGYLSASTALKPASPYAAAKAAAFFALGEHFRHAKVSFAWCRLFHLYGDGEDAGRLVPYVRSRLEQGLPVDLTGGTQIRDYMNVRDAAAELVNVLLSERTGAVNVCSSVGTTVRALVEDIADEYGRRDLLRFGVRAENFTDPPVVVGIRD
jgi:nucleoside-diphosphate-sugar epimerase